MTLQFQARQKGQAIILIVLAMVVLLGFVALAIDGSMIYSDRRFAQNATDAASLAGGGIAAQWLEKKGVSSSNFTHSGDTCTGNADFAADKALLAAISRAQANDVLIDDDISDNNGVEVVCGTENVEASMTSGGSFTLYRNRFMDIRTVTTHQTQTAFAHLAFGGVMENTVTAVTRVRPSQPLAFGYAVVALNPSPCSGNKHGIQSGGSNTTKITGGGIFSNGCMDHDGGSSPQIHNGSVAYFFGGGGVAGSYKIYDADGNLITNNPPVAQLQNNNNYRIPTSAYDVPVPDCNAAGAHKGSSNLIEGKSGLTGLYCITGDIKKGEFSGTDLTVVVLGGKVTIHGSVNIQAPGPGYTGLAIPGVALYLPTQYYGPSCGDVNSELKINGNSGTVISGAVLAPCSDMFMAGGSENNPLLGQVIGWNVNFRGNSDFVVNFDDANKVQKPALLDLLR